jgi:hypothetical protein
MNPTRKPKKPKQVVDKPRKTKNPKKPKQVVDKPRKTNKPKNPKQVVDKSNKPKPMKKGGVRTSISIAPTQYVRPTMSDVQWERFYSTLETRPERKAAFYDSRMYAKYLLYSAYEKTCEIGDATSEACRNFIDEIENLIEKKRRLKMNTRQPTQPTQEPLRGFTTKNKGLGLPPPDYVLNVKPQSRSSPKK